MIFRDEKFRLRLEQQGRDCRRMWLAVACSVAGAAVHQWFPKHMGLYLIPGWLGTWLVSDVVAEVIGILRDLEAAEVERRDREEPD